jgi:hypothetical protein
VFEIADHRNAAGIRRPHRESHAREAVHHHLMRAQTLSEVAVLPFREQVHVELAQQRPEGKSVCC